MYLIIGAYSFIGRHLFYYCKENDIDVLGTYYTHGYDAEWVRFDLCTDNLSGICQEYLDKAPKVIIVCGANTSIDGCKNNEAESNRLNVAGTKRILKQAWEMGVKCVFLSSEAVFDGCTGMYTEEDSPNPVTLYGRQKLQIEQYMCCELEDFLIFRISRAVGTCYGEKDIFDEFYRKIINNEDVTCLKNQKFCLTAVDDIVQGIVKALRQDIKGLYHLSSANYISRFELANLYAEKIFGGYGKIREKEFHDMPFYDNRHVYGGLKGNKLADLLEIHYMDIVEIMDRYADTYRRERRKEV